MTLYLITIWLGAVAVSHRAGFPSAEDAFAHARRLRPLNATRFMVEPL